MQENERAVRDLDQNKALVRGERPKRLASVAQNRAACAGFVFRAYFSRASPPRSLKPAAAARRGAYNVVPALFSSTTPRQPSPHPRPHAAPRRCAAAPLPRPLHDHFCGAVAVAAPRASASLTRPPEPPRPLQPRCSGGANGSSTAAPLLRHRPRLLLQRDQGAAPPGPPRSSNGRQRHPHTTVTQCPLRPCGPRPVLALR